MQLVWALFIGIIAGALARLIMPGKDPGGLVVTMLLGIAGSIVAALIGRALGWYTDLNEGPGLLASVVGALLLLGLYRLVLALIGRRGAIPSHHGRKSS